MRWWAVGMLVVCDCDAGEPPHAKSAPSALETVDSSLALPARAPEPKGPRKDEAKPREVLASASLERFLELAADRFGDELHGRRYAALPTPPNDWAKLLEKWASEHLTWPAIARERVLAGPPSTPGEIVCIASDRIRVFPSDAAPHIALLLFAQGRDPIVGDPFVHAESHPTFSSSLRASAAKARFTVVMPPPLQWSQQPASTMAQSSSVLQSTQASGTTTPG